MDAAWQCAFADLEGILAKAGPQSPGELMPYLIGPLTEEGVWDVIRHAEKIGMIEPVKTPLDTGNPQTQRWGLVEGFDLSKIGIDAEVPA